MVYPNFCRTTLNTVLLLKQTVLPSTIDTMKLQLFTLLLKSLYMYITTVMPTWKTSLGSCDFDTRVKYPELSDTVGSFQLTLLPPLPKSTSTATSVGHVTVGGVLSTENKNRLKCLC